MLLDKSFTQDRRFHTIGLSIISRIVSKNNIILTYQSTPLMCFFKTLSTPPAISSQYDLQHKQMPDQNSSEIRTDCQLLNTPSQKDLFPALGKLDLMLMNCLGMVNFNSQMMTAMDQKLNQAQLTLDSAGTMLAEVSTIQQTAPKRSSNLPLNSPEKEEQNLFETSDSLTKTLFGKTQYQYKLILQGELSSILYKERNFNLSVKLIDIQSGKQKVNGNIINVCLGVCDDLGEWVHETKEGISFLKGKIQSQLYHGSAGFAKMAARDVSRPFPNKTMNLVVYPKPTVLKYSGESSIQEHIEHSLIEPLVVHNISVKAKKRQ